MMETSEWTEIEAFPLEKNIDPVTLTLGRIWKSGEDEHKMYYCNVYFLLLSEAEKNKQATSAFLLKVNKQIANTLCTIKL